MFEIYNDNGVLQVTSKNAYDVVLSSVRTLTSNNIFVKANSFYALQPVVNSKLGISQLFTFSNTNPGYIIVGADNSKIYFFDYEIEAQSKGYGLEIFDVNKTLTFSSHYPSVNIIDHIKTGIFNWNSVTKKNYGTTELAVIPNKIPFVVAPTGTPNISSFITVAWWFENGAFCYGDEIIGRAPPINGDEGFYSSGAIDFLVIDTSHF